ncbi:hypothetical protein SynBIOSE41_00822 [Synechococcus sp. BIOS-E4-1]|uniref:hypothetical protein n=1 Tax=Synechococcus sp. BIOS-E4-1 TaxID=1400864 RepID=UPI00164970C1|nr:hypothetical protein [Synechococcus sp. BIOS-E4-1]QNI53354.1 hypothetical protein SynBIOSE41_00822 [Synechococcus sp. BIOS-E4-1]
MSSFPSVVEAYEQQRVATAKANGFSLFAINGDNECPAHVYTIGLSQFKLPELLCFSTPEMMPGTVAMMSQLAAHLVEGVKRLPRLALVKSLIDRGITVSDPEIHYQPEFLQGDDFVYALQGYVTRATRYRHELGMPRGVLVLNHDGVPTIQQIRAAKMLAAV